MKHDQSKSHMEAALAELRQLIAERYPEARFGVAAGPEDPQEVHLVATVDLEDPDEVLDVVMERMLQFQLDEELPVYVSLRAGHHNGVPPYGLPSGSERHSCRRAELFERPRQSA